MVHLTLADSLELKELSYSAVHYNGWVDNVWILLSSKHGRLADSPLVEATKKKAPGPIDV